MNILNNKQTNISHYMKTVNKLNAAVRILILAVCALVCASGLSAYAKADDDSYTPMVEEGYEWGYYYEELPVPCESKFYYRLQFLGDSIVDGKTYKKLYMYRSEKLNPDLQRPLALMREEGRKVYMYPPDYIFDRHAIDYPEEWRTLWLRFMFYSGMDNLIYDFNADVNTPIININYIDWIAEILVHKDVRNFSTGSEDVYFTVEVDKYPYSDQYLTEEYFDDNFYFNKTIQGIGVLSYGYRNGILPFPTFKDISSTYDPCHFLLYKRDLDGTMHFVNDENAEYMADDPTIKEVSLANLSADFGSELWIDGGTLHGNVDCTVFDLHGIMLHSGVAEGYRFPASGVYMLKTANRVGKVAVTI